MLLLRVAMRRLGGGTGGCWEGLLHLKGRHKKVSRAQLPSDLVFMQQLAGLVWLMDSVYSI
jgi:hypothetical protein